MDAVYCAIDSRFQAEGAGAEPFLRSAHKRLAIA